ncbi:DNA topoisomerase I [Candidatus Woesearchaeota archaeon]|nr:DNA topoisomerase I [Candidatus Woesearchaeota archaeon]
MTELIITEKPSSAKKVAEALADTKPVQKKRKQTSYFELTHNKKKVLVTSAVGHLYGLVEAKKDGWTYPVFDIKWEPTYLSSKELKFVKEYIDTISDLCAKADEFTIACDYDVEGEVIGWNVIRFACKKKDANRMKFSTLTKPDLVDAYEHKTPHLDWGQALAGETRHKLDWFYGINVSRALMAAVKAAGSFKVMSAGRVQGPALKLLVDREKEIQAFKPEPYWMIRLEGKYEKNTIEAWHDKDKIFDKTVADKIMQIVKGQKEAAVKDVKRTKRTQAPPHPFDLTTLQSEAYRVFKITPKETLALAQTLYLAGVTSYPRTSSQKLDPKLGFQKILAQLQKQSAYQELCSQLLKKKQLVPNDGQKTDPAHPAIYPTGLTPKALKPKEQKVYDLIVKRFLATFADPAVRETMEVSLDVNKESFTAKGTRTIEENWHVFYAPYVTLEEVTLPDIKKDDRVAITKIDKLDKETQPPNRFNQSSIIKELEKRNLGTKATRADILDRLFQRGYIEGIQIQVTELGIETTRILAKFTPAIIDEKLTADFEEEMEKIREGKQKQEKILEQAQKHLVTLLTDFKKKEKEIGKEILQSLRETQEAQNTIGSCPTCGKGVLMMKRGKFGRFIACERYPECTTTFKIPQTGLIKRSDNLCEHDGHPKIQVIMKGKRPREICIKPDCKSKVPEDEAKEIKEIKQHKVEKKCPKCGKDLVVRKSFYGEFLACSGFPKCRYTESFDRKTHHFENHPKSTPEKAEPATAVQKSEDHTLTKKKAPKKLAKIMSSTKKKENL